MAMGFFPAKTSPPGERPKLNVLVTGAAGYIGRIVARDLSEHHTVRGVDMRPMSDLKDHRVIDLNDYDEIYDALEGIDAIAHLAWPMRPYEGIFHLEIQWWLKYYHLSGLMFLLKRPCCVLPLEPTFHWNASQRASIV